MVIDPEILAERRKLKIADLTGRRNGLLEALSTAQKTDKWRIKALLVTVERSLRWQLAREGLTGDDCECTGAKNTYKAARIPDASPSTSA